MFKLCSRRTGIKCGYLRFLPINRYFWLRFGYGNATNHFLKFNHLCCVWRKFQTFNTYYLKSSYKIWVRFIVVYQKSLIRSFQTGFEHKITFGICVFALFIHKGYLMSKIGVKCLYLILYNTFYKIFELIFLYPCL